MDDYVCSMCGESIYYDEHFLIPFTTCGCLPDFKTREVPVNITQDEYNRGIRAFMEKN